MLKRTSPKPVLPGRVFVVLALKDISTMIRDCIEIRRKDGEL